MEGWSINENLAFFDDQKLPENLKEIQKVLIDEDLREFGEPIFQNLIDKSTTNLDLSTSPKIVQLVKLRNVQVPKIRESSENFSDNSAIWRIFLTDGHTTVSGIIMESIKGLTTETPPGTKCKIHGKINIESNFLLLTKNNIQIIGGNVEKLIEKWKIEKSGEKTTKSASLAPKWIPFGKRQKQNESAPKLDKNFKANQVLPKKESNENESTEFSKNREEVLKNLENEDQKVFSRPNVQIPEKVPTQPKPRPQTTTTEKSEKMGKKPRRGRKNSEDDDAPLPDYVKPGNAPTLFDFIGASTGIEEEIRNMHIPKQQNPTPKHPTSSFSVSTNPRNTSRGNRGDQKHFTPRTEPSNQQQQQHQDSSSYQQQSRRNQGPRTKSFQENQKKGVAINRGTSHNQGESRRFDNQTGPKSHENKDNHDQGESRRNSNQKVPKKHENKGNQGESRQNDNQKGPRNHENKAQNYSSPRESNRGEPSRKQFHDASKPSPAKNQNYSKPGDVRLSGGNRQLMGNNPRYDYQQSVNQEPQPNPAPRFFQPQQQAPMWQIGSQCMAPWQDGRIYPAEILQFLPNRQCVIRYSEYGNTTEIPIDVLMYC